ncbi:hypothetical protein JCM33374_g6663 [Metschnikowia sp. JCM 33374]|nr:hypothetical protein JCM33374_g6663 [Metschnikowia sp. JCM 33374]
MAAIKKMVPRFGGDREGGVTVKRDRRGGNRLWWKPVEATVMAETRGRQPLWRKPREATVMVATAGGGTEMWMDKRYGGDREGGKPQMVVLGSAAVPAGYDRFGPTVTEAVATSAQHRL